MKITATIVITFSVYDVDEAFEVVRSNAADGELGLNHLCAGYLHFFTHVDGLMQVMAGAIRRGGFADEVMQVLGAAGRNDPCPCGSGRKTKHCHP